MKRLRLVFLAPNNYEIPSEIPGLIDHEEIADNFASGYWQVLRLEEDSE